MGGLLGVDASGNPVYDTRVDASGNPLAATAPTQVNTYTAGNQKWSTVAMDVEGDFVITWSSFGQDAANGYGVYAQQFDPSGNAVRSPFLVNTTTQGNQYLSTVAMDAQGDFIVSWTGANPNDPNGTLNLGTEVYARAFHAAGQQTMAETQINTTTQGNQKDSDVAMDLSGDYVITWESARTGRQRLRDLRQERFINGQASAEFKVNTTTQGDQVDPSVAMSHLVLSRSLGTATGLQPGSKIRRASSSSSTLPAGFPTAMKRG